MDAKGIISSFLKIMALDFLDLSKIEPDFDSLEDQDSHLGYLSEGEKALYLVLLFCERQALFHEEAQEKVKDKTRYYEELNYWNEKRDAVSFLLNHCLRLHFETSYLYEIKIVEDFLAVATYKSEVIITSLN